MGEPDGIGSEIARFSGYCPLIAFGQCTRDTTFSRIRRLVHFGFLVGFGVPILDGDMCCGQGIAGTQVIRIDIEKKLALFDSLSFGSFRFRDALFLCFAFGSFAFSHSQFLCFGALLCGRHSRIKRLAEEGEQQQ